MAVIVPTVKDADRNDGAIKSVVWGPMANGDTGTPVSLVSMADKSLQIDGTFGAGGSITLQGSNDETTPTNWYALTKPGATAATLTAAGIVAIVENTRWVRPAVTAGDGTTALNARLVARRANPMRT